MLLFFSTHSKLTSLLRGVMHSNHLRSLCSYAQSGHKAKESSNGSRQRGKTVGRLDRGVRLLDVVLVGLLRVLLRADGLRLHRLGDAPTRARAVRACRSLSLRLRPCLRLRLLAGESHALSDCNISCLHCCQMPHVQLYSGTALESTPSAL